MPEIILSNQPLRADTLSSMCGVSPQQLMDISGRPPAMLVPYQPYLYTDQPPSGLDHGILRTLRRMHRPESITDIARMFGGDNTLAIAEIGAGLREFSTGTIGAATGVYGQRMEQFALSVEKYQKALLAYRDVVRNNPAGQAVARQKAIEAFQKMQTGFRNEVSTITSQIHAHKGTPLGSARRGLNIARDSRSIAKLKVTSQAQAGYLMNFGKYAKVLGTGLVAIDFGSRIGEIHNSYQAGENWEREMFVESTSFAAGAAMGAIVANAGAALAGCIVAATPAGWILIVVGLGVAGLAAGTSMCADHFVKEKSGSWYDEIMKRIDALWN